MKDKYKLSEERLRARFASLGIDGFTPRSALELLLGYAVGGRELIELIERLFEKYGDITRILNADPEELSRIPGMTEEALDIFFVMPQLFSVCSTMNMCREGLDDVKTACEYFSDQLRWTPVEQFKLACLNDNFAALCCVTIGVGSGTEVNVSTDEIVRIAMEKSSRFVIIGHNHPSGSCRPSESDLRSTEALRDTLRTCGIILLDHIVVGLDGACSIMRSGEYPIRTDEREIAEALRQ